MSMSEIRGNVAQAFEDVIKNLTQRDLDKLGKALDDLSEFEPSVYTALMGHTLMHDILISIRDERLFRCRFTHNNNPMSELGKQLFDLGTTLARAVVDAQKIKEGA